MHNAFRRPRASSGRCTIAVKALSQFVRSLRESGARHGQASQRRCLCDGVVWRWQGLVAVVRCCSLTSWNRLVCSSYRLSTTQPSIPPTHTPPWPASTNARSTTVGRTRGQMERHCLFRSRFEFPSRCCCSVLTRLNAVGSIALFQLQNARQ